MSILTGHELQFLASLSKRWSRLYYSELARLMEEEDDATPDTKPVPSFGSRRPLSVVRTENQ
ncbi:MAG TPA: hypothetical protein VNY08_17980 [Bradyrhizobium sp.]|nr:hypothetical protein [Bradyrhizobium sp.]